MAKSKSVLLQSLSGKLDNYVICHSGNKTYVRRRPERMTNPKSEGQMAQRAKLTGGQAMYRMLKNSVLKEVNDIAARENDKRSGYLWFLHANMNAFGADNYIDYSLLRLTAGSLQQVFALEMTRADEKRLELKWMNNSCTVTSQSTDRLMVAAIFDDEPFTPVMLSGVKAVRKDGYAFVNLPEGEWQTVHLYCFFGMEGGKRYSPCVYFNVSKPE